MLLGIWDLSSLTRVQLSPPALKKKCGILTTGPPGKSPTTILFDSPTNDPFGRHRVCVSKYPHFTDKGWNHFALCYQSVPLRCAKARRFIFFFFSQLFPTVQGLENLGGQRLGRVEVRLLVRSAIKWSWPHHRQTAAARWGCPSGHAALKAATPGWLSASGLWESGWEMARQLAVTLTLMDLVSPAFPPTPPTREMGLWP